MARTESLMSKLVPLVFGLNQQSNIYSMNFSQDIDILLKFWELVVPLQQADQDTNISQAYNNWKGISMYLYFTVYVIFKSG